MRLQIQSATTHKSMEGEHKSEDNKKQIHLYVEDNVAQNHRWIEQNAKSQDMPESSRISFGCLHREMMNYSRNK